MFTKKSAPGVREQRRGFTMVELIAVLAMLAVLAAAAIPSIAGFIEHGHQVNRNNIARTLYLAVQSELVKMKSEGRLINELATPYFTPAANGYTLDTVPDDKNVYKRLGITPTGDEAENADSVVYISKPRGSAPAPGEESDFYEILDRVVLDKSILNNAILMEYNVETGVVLSIFYGDTEAFADGKEFVYDASLAGTDDEIYTITGNRGYEFAEQRKQGYYGANGTGDLLPPPDMMPQTEIFDGAFKPILRLESSRTPGVFNTEISGMENVLYVEAYLPTGADLANYSLSLVPVDGSAEIPVMTWDSVSRVYGPFTVSRPIVQHGITRTAEFEMYIILLDLVDGTTNNPSRIEELGITTPHTVHARVTEKGTSFGEMSTTFAHTLFYGEMNGGFEVTSARHLYNIRYVPGGTYYQIENDWTTDGHINMLPGNPNNITSFAPIPEFSGSYSAWNDNALLEIQNLTITTDNATNGTGLFGKITAAGVIHGIGLRGVSITANTTTDDGSVGAIAGESAGKIYSSYSEATGARLISGTSTGNLSIGGLVGKNTGDIARSRNNVPVENKRGDVNGTPTGGANGETGGIAGENRGAGRIIQIANTANVTGVSNVGGLVGRNEATLIEPSVGAITITGSSEIGGVAGRTNKAIDKAAVTGTTIRGNTVMPRNNVGGVVGSADGAEAKITNATVTDAKITAIGENVGGVAGYSGAEITGARVGDDIKTVEIKGGRWFIGGIVGDTKGPITDAHVINATITGYGRGESIEPGTDPSRYVGGIAGRSGDINQPTSGGISNVSVTNVKIEATSEYIGGIAGGNHGAITDATVKGTIDWSGTTPASTTTISGAGYIGGIAGNATAAIGEADTDITVDGVVIQGTQNNVGGVVGLITNANVTNTAVTNADISGTAQFVGGTAGRAAQAVAITGSKVGAETAPVTITASAVYSGGVVGGAITDANTVVQATTVTITAAAVENVTVTGTSQVGGVVGQFNPASGGSIGGAAPNGITVKDATVTGTGNQIGGVAGNTTRSITNATVSGTRTGAASTTTISGVNQVGGIAGSSSGAIGDDTPNGIQVTDANVTGLGDGDGVGANVGGIAGASRGKIRNAKVSGGEIKGRYMVGGVAGVTSDTISDSDVENTNVTSRSSNGGGIAGAADNPAGVISSCTVTGGTYGNKVTGDGTERASNYIGGAVGKTQADITDITVSGMNVAIRDSGKGGGASVGGILGGTEKDKPATVSNVIAIETKVEGTPAGNIGGIVGFIDGATGKLQNATYLSTANDAQITGTGAIGGIVGHNLGTISDVLFLALAPQTPATGVITPITEKTGAGVTNAYYLKGKPIRPTEGEINPPSATDREGYNLEDLSGDEVGEGYSTWALYDKFNAATGGYTLGNPAGDWARLTTPVVLTQEDAISTDNDTYPYPYTTVPGKEVLPENPYWPIVEEDVVFGGEGYYYELDTDGNYYVWNGNGLVNDKELKEAGYVIFAVEDIADAVLFYRPAGSDEWKPLMKPGPTSGSTMHVTIPAAVTGNLAEAANQPSGTFAYILPLKEMAAAVGGSATPLELMYKLGDDGPDTLLENYIHPLFAKATFAKSVTEFNNFYIRTPWQMQNIGKLTTANVSNDTEGKTFTQDRSFKVTVSDQSAAATWLGIDADADPSVIADHTLVDGEPEAQRFFGTFIGTNFEITNLPFGKGLFATIGKDNGKIIGVTVKKHESGASSSTIGTIARKNEGLIEDCVVEGSVFNLGVNASKVGFIVGENSGTITGCLVRDSSITNGSSDVGGVAGVSSTMIKNSGVINSTIGGTATSIGGIVGTNTGTVEDVFFLSTVTPAEIAATDSTHKDPPVSDDGGGIVGIHQGHDFQLARALYLAVAPTDGTTIYPITRSGMAADDCFYLFGAKYRLSDTKEWVKKPDNTLDTYNMTKPNLGKRLDTLGFLEQNLLEFEEVNLGLAWEFHTGDDNYPYPIIDGMTLPELWPVTDGSNRPEQHAGNFKEGTEPHVERLAFLNGEFADAYVADKAPKNLTSDNFIPNEPDYKIPVGKGEDANVQDTSNPGSSIPAPMWLSSGVHAYMWGVNGWSTRPQYNATNQDKNGMPGWMYAIELLNPRNDYGFASITYDGKTEDTSDKVGLTGNPGDGTYAELNAAMTGTLYQTTETDPGQEFYYTFHHLTRLHEEYEGQANTMKFFLSPVTPNADKDPSNVQMANEDEMVLIRPVESPRDDVDGRMINLHGLTYQDYKNWVRGPKATPNSANFPGAGKEQYTNLFDRKPLEEWYAETNIASGGEAWIRWDYGGPITLSGYSLTPGDDVREGDARAWELQGSNDPTFSNYETLDARDYTGENANTPWPNITGMARNETGFVIDPASRGAYQYYRLVIKDTRTHVNPTKLADIDVFVEQAWYPAGAINTAAWNTVHYSGTATEGLQDYWKNMPSGAIHLYDVWIGDKAEGGSDYGLTFWSTTDYNLNLYGYADETALPSEAQTNVIGYWDIDNGWKQYYGSYTVPEGQTTTEFAYQSTMDTLPTIGNFLDGADFQEAASLTISEDITVYEDDGTTKAADQRSVIPGEIIEVKLTVKAYGGLTAQNVRVVNDLHPFHDYFDLVDGSVKLNGNNYQTPAADADTLTVEIPSDLLKQPDDPYDPNKLNDPAEIAKVPTVEVSFRIQVREEVRGSTYTTLFYSLQNQARVEYTSFQKDKLRGKDEVNYSSDWSRPIGVMPMDKKIVAVNGTALADTDKPIGKKDDVFTVELSVNTSLATNGLISDSLPDNFQLDETSVQMWDGTQYVTAKKDTDWSVSGNTLTFYNVNFTDQPMDGATAKRFRYTMTYKGDAFGVTRAGSETYSYYRFRYDMTTGETALITQGFTQPLLGVPVTAPDYAATVPTGQQSVGFADGSNLYDERLPYAGVDLNPTIHLYDENKTELTGTAVPGGTQFTHPDGYTMTLVQLEGKYYLNFDFADTDNNKTITLYYKIQAAGGGFDLTSDMGKITLTVDKDALEVQVQAALPSTPAPRAVLPPVAAATLGLLGAPLGGEAAVGLGLQNGVSAAVSVLLGAVALLLVLTGLALLPEKKRRSRPPGAGTPQGGRDDDE